jgi:hypothetical protein
MRLFVVAPFLVAFLDALSTYIVVASGRDVEANPAFAAVINSNPASVFFLWLISAAPMSIATIVVERLAGRLPAALRVRVMRILSAAYTAAILFRIVVVVNNVILAL